MKVIFTTHARTRMRERGIFEKDIVDCVLHADRIVKDDVRVYRFQKLVSYGTLEVVGRYKGTYIIVITAYPL